MIRQGNVVPGACIFNANSDSQPKDFRPYQVTIYTHVRQLTWDMTFIFIRIRIWAKRFFNSWVHTHFMKLLNNCLSKCGYFRSILFSRWKLDMPKCSTLMERNCRICKFGPGGVWYKDSVYKIRRSHDYIIFIIEMVIVSKWVLYFYHPRNDKSFSTFMGRDYCASYVKSIT